LPEDKDLKDEVRKEAHKSRFVVHSRSIKMYRDLKEYYWWPNIKKKNSCVYGQIWCMSTSKHGTSKASKVIATTFDTLVEVRRYHYELCDRIA
jgi:hypothetical protein